MNLRQKVKQAKKDLARLEREYKREHSQWGMVQNCLARNKVRSIIDYKRKLNRHFKWNEQPEIDWCRLTYFKFVAGGETLAVLKSPNGKPLNPKVVDEFLTLIMQTKFQNYAKKISEMDWIKVDKPLIRNHEERHNTVEYELVVSNDRTKQKRLHRQTILYQMRGSGQIYKPQN